MSHRSRIALCLSGQMRTYRECYANLKRFVLDPLHPDIFVHTWRNSGCTNKMDEILARRYNRFIRRFTAFEFPESEVTYEELEILYAPRKAVIEEFVDSYTNELAGIRVPEVLKQKEPKHYRGSLPMFYKMKQCNELRRTYEKEHDFQYDIVIRLRPDLMFEEPIPPYVFEERGILHYEQGSPSPLSNHINFNDKFAISCPEFMDYYSGAWNFLPEYWQEPLGDGSWEKHRVGERLMMYHMSRAPFAAKMFHMKCPMHRPAPVIKRQGPLGPVLRLIERFS